MLGAIGPGGQSGQDSGRRNAQAVQRRRRRNRRRGGRMRPQPFADWMKFVQSGMEDALSSFLPSAVDVPSRLQEAMRYAVLDGGKRVRPLQVFAAGDVFDAEPDVLSRAAAAVEMIHAYSLVHDDMPCMDDDALRRGKPTVHVMFVFVSVLLVGDALQSQAFLCLFFFSVV